jgi:hypothetical protein
LLAQLTLYPVQNNTQSLLTVAKVKSLAPLVLPFWDDFSSPVNSDTLWDEKSTVWVNSGMGINPPTINVATFDGLDANGVPYSPNPNQNLDYGLTDSLISRRIKMTDVPLFERNSVFLSFFYQWGGYGEPPDLNDFLRVEFLNSEGVWEAVVTLQSNDQELPNEFYSQTIRINQDRFFHDDFQFRFQSSGRQSGRYDSWNIDYVYLNKGRDENDLLQGFPDRAPTVLLTALFGRYYSLPQRHFISDTENNTGYPSFAVHNLSSIPQPMNYDVHANLTRYEGGVPSEQTFTVATAQPILPTVAGFETRELTFTSKPDLSPYVTADSVFLTLQTTLITGDSVNTGFEPLDFYMNDTIRQQYTLKDYYAYDDGSAEYAVGLAASGNLAAYRFVLKTGSQDTLNGVYVHYPFTAGTSASNTLFMVWSNDNGKPGQLLLEELVPVQRKANNEFILRPFIQSVIVKDTFFIGWRQPITGRVQFGLDASQDTGEHLFENVTGNWVQNTLIKGSVMLRPRFGTGDLITSIYEPVTEISIYPNPNLGEFTVRGEFSQLQILSSTGQTMAFETEDHGEEKRIRVSHAAPGLYILRYRAGNRFLAEKMIIRN